MALYHKLGDEEIKIVDFFIKNNKDKDLTIFDIGCNRGLFSDLFINLKNTNIHCFEPIDELYNNLVIKYSNKNNVRLNKLGVSDKNGETSFYRLLNLETDGCSSLIERPVFKERGWKYEKYLIKTITINEYCHNNNVDFIDFIKIDVEGVEYLVLKGMYGLLKNKKIKMIQFEYGNTFIDAGFSLKLVFDLIKECEYNMFYFKNDVFIEVTDVNLDDISKNDNINLILKYD